MLLVIDTSTRNAGAALAREGQVVSSRSWRSTVNHTAELMPAVVQLLAAAMLTVNDLEGIAVALGPGGFSALRVGMSVAKGLALATSPAAGRHWHPGRRGSTLPPLRLARMRHAGRGARRGGHVQVSAPMGSVPGKTVFAPLRNCCLELSGQQIFCGEGTLPHTQLIKDRLGDKAVVAGHSPAARLWALAELGHLKLEAGDGDDVATLQPYYLRMPTIGGPKRRDRVRQGT